MNPLSSFGAGLPVASTPLSVSQLPTSLPQSAASAPTVAVSATAVQPVSAATDAKAGKHATADPEALQDAVDKIEKVANTYNRELKFSIDEDLGISVVKVMDKESGDLIRQIPSEDMLELAKGLDKLIGLFVKQEA